MKTVSSVLAMTRVKNKSNETDEEKVDWIALWKEYKGVDNPKCSNLSSCTKVSNYIVGGHVYKVDDKGKAIEPGVYYIVPLCQSCNSANNEDPFNVFSSVMVKESDLLAFKNNKK